MLFLRGEMGWDGMGGKDYYKVESITKLVI